MNADDALTIARAARAELPQTEAAFDGLERQFYEEILTTGVDQVEKRERLFMGIRVIRKVKQALLDATVLANAADYRDLVAQTGLTRTS